MFQQQQGSKPGSSFELLYSGKANGVFPVYKYRSRDTGLTVSIAQVEGPLVKGYFTLATETHDDDGLLHVLEHVIFLGSEEYPYKGVLDLLANRSFASGTNAWTDYAFTYYSLETAGAEGFLNLMPIFLDHLLYPTLTDSAYTTEVYHITAEGKDAGVVYSEMQGYENTEEILTYLNMLRSMYPGRCGYKYEVGGLLANLRSSTSNAKVKNYHKEFYRAENLCLIITGQVQPEEVFSVLRPFEAKILSKGELPPFRRPWQSSVPPLDSSVERLIPFPTDDESSGSVLVAWRGPPQEKQYIVSGLNVLIDYLADTSVAPFQRDFIEIEEPYCSQVYGEVVQNSESFIYFGFNNAPTSKLPEIKAKALNLITKFADRKEEIDMIRMKNVINRKVLSTLSTFEDSPHFTLVHVFIKDFLYGNTSDDLEVRLNELKSFKKLELEPQGFWVDLIKTYFIGQPSVAIIGKPSKQRMQEIGQEEKERVSKRREKLGEKGLREKAEELKKAKQNNDVEPPDEMKSCVPVPDSGSIHFHNIRSSNNFDETVANKNEEFPLADIPALFLLDNIKTKFVTMRVLMDSRTAPKEIKAYLPLLVAVMPQTPITRNGELVPFEEVIKQLSEDTLSNSASVGLCELLGVGFSPGDGVSDVAILKLKVEREKYQKGIYWLRDLLYRTQLTADRLRIVATKMVNDVATDKRDGSNVTEVILRNIIYKKESNHYIDNVIRQQYFLNDLIKKLDSENDTTQVIDDMNRLREAITKPDTIRFHVAVDVGALAQETDPERPWQDMLLEVCEDKHGSQTRQIMRGGGDAIANSKRDHEYVNPITGQDSTNIIIGVGAVESSFLLMATPCVTSHKDTDYPAIMVYLQYLIQMEGPMWKQIRGMGLAYRYGMSVNPDNGLLYFRLGRANNLPLAYQKAKEILDGFLSGATPFSDIDLETCKSSLIFSIVEKETTPSELSYQSLLFLYRGLPADYNRELIGKIAQVDLEDLKRVGNRYLKPLFEPNMSSHAICCHPSKVEEITNKFKEMSRDLTVLDSLEDSWLTKM